MGGQGDERVTELPLGLGQRHQRSAPAVAEQHHGVGAAPARGGARKHLAAGGGITGGWGSAKRRSASRRSSSVKGLVVVQNSTRIPLGSTVYTDVHQRWSISATS